MNRRGFIGLAGGAMLARSYGARAQQPGRIYRVALVLPVGRDNPASLAFLDELQKEGFAEGRNLVILGGAATSNEQVSAMLPAILEGAPDLILTGGDPIARAFQKATQSIPILAMTEDLVGAGFAASMARPGGNVTGISLMSPELDGKRQDILIEAVPNATRIAALADSNVASLEHVASLERSARSQGKELVLVSASTASEIIPAMNQASSKGAGGLNVLSSPMLQFNRRGILDHAIRLRLPAIYQWPETALEGGLLGYGPSFIAVFRQRARMAIKVLRGTSPSDLPVEQPSLFQFVINLRTARAMNIGIPAALELRADRLVE